MNDWIPIKLTCKLEALEVANKLAYIIDPDTGGLETFSASQTLVNDLEETVLYTETMMKPDYANLVEAKDANMIFNALTYLATEYSRNLPVLEDCTIFANSVELIRL